MSDDLGNGTGGAVHARPSDEDLAQLFRYLDDELEELEAMRFEVRLSEDAALAEELERIAPADRLQRALFSSDPAAPARGGSLLRRRSLPGRWLPWAAAALLLAAGALALRAAWPRPDRFAFDATVLGFERQLSDEAARVLGEGSGSLPLRGGGQGDREGPDGAAALVQELASAESARAESALDEGLSQARGAYYALAVRAPVAAQAVVIELVPGVPPRLARPGPDAAPVFLLGARTVTWLPAPPVDTRQPVEDVPEDAWRRPFLVPRGAGAVAAIVAARPAPIDADLLAAIDARLARAPAVADAAAPEAAAALTAWLRDHGLATQTFLVREPR